MTRIYFIAITEKQFKSLWVKVELVHYLEGAIVCPEPDARHILEPNRKATEKNRHRLQCYTITAVLVMHNRIAYTNYRTKKIVVCKRRDKKSVGAGGGYPKFHSAQT